MDTKSFSISNKNWTAFKQRVQNRWRDISDHEIERCRGRFAVLSGIIARRCNESRNAVMDYIDNLWFEIYVRGSRHRFQG